MFNVLVLGPATPIPCTAFNIKGRCDRVMLVLGLQVGYLMGSFCPNRTAQYTGLKRG